MSDIKLVLFRQMDTHPLYQYREQKKDCYRLAPLLIGYGPRLEQLFDVVLCSGQLLNTDFSITVATPNPTGAAQALQQRAPELSRFVEIYSEGELLTQETEMLLAQVRFESCAMTPEGIQCFLEANPKHSYLVISTGQDTKNRALAQACAQFPFGAETCLAYVQKKAAEAVTPVDERTAVCVLPEENPEDFRSQTEQVALNLHYAYSKSLQERISFSQVVKEFYEPACYASNMEAALHIRSKLASCEIFDEDPAVAASKFAKLMADKPEMLRRLSVLEHNRWMLSKLCQGFRQQDQLDRIYLNGATTHSNAEKWHCCLVPRDPDGRTDLRREDWSSSSIRKNLDQMDCMSLQIHRKCRQICKLRENMIRDMLQSLQNSLMEDKRYSAQTREYARDLERIILHMSQGKTNVIALYRETVKRLQQQIEAESGTMRSFLLDLVATMVQNLEPLVEYVSCKDYKRQDELLVQQIPFALTHKCRPVIVKPFSEKRIDNLYAVWQMDADRAIYCIAAGSMMELREILASAEPIHRFLHEAGISDSWIIWVPKALEPEDPEIIRLLSGLPAELSYLEDLTAQDICRAVDDYLQFEEVDYADCTGTNSMVCHAVQKYAEAHQIGAFYVHRGQMYDLGNAEEVRYPAPRKSLGIREMFNLSGAVYTASAAQKCGDFSLMYQKLFDLAMEYQNEWSLFTGYIGRHCDCEEPADRSCRFLPLKHLHKKEKAVQSWEKFSLFTESREAAASVQACLRELEEEGYVQKPRSARAIGSGYDLSYELNPAAVSRSDGKSDFPQVLERYLSEYTGQSRWMLNPEKTEFRWTNLEVQNLSISEIVKSYGNPKSFAAFLIRLKEDGFIRHYAVNEEKQTVSFRFASEDIQECLTKPGSILEYEIYYSALLEGRFDDVDMGVEFLHSPDHKAAKNEIDVICNRGAASLFISAKFRNEVSLELKSFGTSSEPIYNYILYEITLEAEKFGLNAKPVLADPLLSQFDQTSDGTRVLSKAARRAESRGVYLVGRECFESSKMLAQVLNRIMDGRDDWYSV